MRSALANFEREIARIDKLADWLTTPSALNSDMVPATWAMRCGAVVLLSGYFETFLKECMRAFIMQLNGLGKPLDRLPDQLRFVHFEKGGLMLKKQVKIDRKMGSDTALCKDLATRIASLSMTTGYTLAWEAFADTEANPGPAVVGGLLGAVGIKNPWTKLRAAAPIGLGVSEIYLTSFIEMRNECAHSGNTTSPPTASDLIQHGANIGGLGKAFVTVLEARLAEIAAL